MLRLDLAALDRFRSLDVQGAWAPEDAGPAEGDLRFETPVAVSLVATLTATDQILVRGELSTTLGQVCRRCLDPVTLPFVVPVALFFQPTRNPGSEDDGGEIREFPTNAVELDLAQALREELACSAPAYVECGANCRGLCPGCGANRSETTCDCSVEEPDPRWEVLRALTNK